MLLSNDDGFDAPGLHALADAMADRGEVWIVAPDSEQSGKSHSLTLHRPLRARHRGPRRFAVDGTPADCMYLALHELMDGPPDLVLSGINRGANLGTDVHYSGTVAAAREAAFAHIPALAVSLYLTEADAHAHYVTAATVARRLVTQVVDAGMPDGTLLNLNVPNVPLAELKGVRAARLGVRYYDNRVLRREDPWGRAYYWIGGAHRAFDDDPETDGPLVEQGWAAVTPLHADHTLHPFLDVLSDRLS